MAAEPVTGEAGVLTLHATRRPTEEVQLSTAKALRAGLLTGSPASLSAMSVVLLQEPVRPVLGTARGLLVSHN